MFLMNCIYSIDADIFRTLNFISPHQKIWFKSFTILHANRIFKYCMITAVYNVKSYGYDFNITTFTRITYDVNADILYMI